MESRWQDLSSRPYYEIKVCFYSKFSYHELPSSSSKCYFVLGYWEQPKSALIHNRNWLPWNEQLGINPWPYSSKDFLSASLANLTTHFSNRKRRFHLDTTKSRAVFCSVLQNQWGAPTHTSRCWRGCSWLSYSFLVKSRELHTERGRSYWRASSTPECAHSAQDPSQDEKCAWVPDPSSWLFFNHLIMKKLMCLDLCRSLRTPEIKSLRQHSQENKSFVLWLSHTAPFTNTSRACTALLSQSHLGEDFHGNRGNVSTKTTPTLCWRYFQEVSPTVV